MFAFIHSRAGRLLTSFLFISVLFTQTMVLQASIALASSEENITQETPPNNNDESQKSKEKTTEEKDTVEEKSEQPKETSEEDSEKIEEETTAPTEEVSTQEDTKTEEEDSTITNDANLETTVDTNANTGENTANGNGNPPKKEDCINNIDEETTHKDNTQENIEQNKKSEIEDINAKECKKENTQDTQNITPTQEKNTQENNGGNIDEKTPNENENKVSEEKDREKSDEKESEKDKESSPEKTEDSQKEKGNAQIETGDAIANSTLANEANTTSIGENTLALIKNLYGVVTGDIDLYTMFMELLKNAEKDETCETKDKCAQMIDLTIDNDADITNDVNTQANSGKNETNDNKGEATVTTGDAIADTALANIANTTLVGDNWMFVMINVFGSWFGDLLVPSKESLPHVTNTQTALEELNITNNANIQDNVDTTANTGDNETNENKRGGKVQTGDATAISTVVTEANKVVVEDNWFSLAVNNMGVWTGYVLNWDEVGNQFYPVFTYDIDADEEDQNTSNSSLPSSIDINNNANISNNVTTTATTGENTANNNRAGQITTGDASAFSTVYNFVNNTFVGSNWFYGVVNIFGQWNGDIEFAQPDLTINISDDRDTVPDKSIYPYYITVKNNGSAPAQNVTISLDEPEELSITSSSISRDAGKWTLGTMEPGEQQSFSITMRAKDVDEDTVAIVSSEVSTTSKESNTQNNSDQDHTTITTPPIEFVSNDNDKDSKKNAGELSIKRKDATPTEVFHGGLITHEISVTNKGDKTVHDVTLDDTMRGPSGEKLVTFTWDIGTVHQDEKVIVAYDIVMQGGAQSGQYTMSARASGKDARNDIIETDSAKTHILVLGAFSPAPNFAELQENTQQEENLIPTAEAQENTGVVLGATSCQPLPIWFLFSAMIAHMLAIHWSFFQKIGDHYQTAPTVRRLFGTGSAMFLSVIFWLSFFCGMHLWWPLTMLGITLVVAIFSILSERKKQTPVF